MKRSIVFFLLLLFSFSLIQAASASLKEKQAELAKIKQYLIVLDNNIKKARAAKLINKIAELKEIKRSELARAKVLKAEIAQLETLGQPARPSPAASPKAAAKPAAPKAGRSRGFMVEGGLGCGAGLVRGSYLMPVRGNIDLVVDGGFALGNGFSATIIDLGARFLVGRGFVGLEVGMANYSKTVSGVPGVSGNLSGSNTGIGLYGGTAFGDIEARAGYNTAAGLIGTVGYRF